MIQLSLDLSVTEADRLARCEAVIERGLQTFVDVGLALMEIRDSRLYRRDYGTFEDYCRERWNFTDRRARMLVASAEVIGNIGTVVPLLPSNERQIRPLTSLPADEQVIVWQRAVDTAPEGKITAAHVQSVVDEHRGNGHKPELRPVSYHVSDDSYEWYTPEEYIEAARRVMDGIDLDPASSDIAQTVVRAGTYYTKDDDGLSSPWFGRVWLNPPYNMPLVEDFTRRAVDDYQAGIIEAAIVLTNNSTDTAWFHRLARYPFCLTRGRIQFWGANDLTLATRQGQALFYLGGDLDLFSAAFSNFGLVVIGYDHRKP